MIPTTWERPGDRRYFVHKKLLKIVKRVAIPAISSLVPGGSTILGIGRTLIGGAPIQTITRAAPSCATDAGFIQLVKTKSWADVARICGTTVPAAMARFAPFRAQVFPTSTTPSIPPVNPVRAAVVTAKAVALAPPVAPLGPLTLRMIAHLAKGGGTAAAHVRHGHTKGMGPQMPLHQPIIQAFQQTFKPSSLCLPPFRRDAAGDCVPPFLGVQPGIDPTGVGEAVMGRYGAGYVPGGQPIVRKTCLPGDVLGNDSICYPKRAIRNSDRKFPRGRQPLLTGGEMRAISIAARAAGKFERTQKRLQKLGMIRKPARGASRRQIEAGVRTEMHHRQITAGGG